MDDKKTGVSVRWRDVINPTIISQLWRVFVSSGPKTRDGRTDGITVCLSVISNPTERTCVNHNTTTSEQMGPFSEHDLGSLIFPLFSICLLRLFLRLDNSRQPLTHQSGISQ